MTVAQACAIFSRMRTADIETEYSLLKTIAGASRPLDKDLNLSGLQAIDRLQKTQARFREQWIGPSPWLVLADGWTIPNAPVEEMLKAMGKHGDPVGMVGIAWLTHSKRVAILQMLFRSKANKKSNEMVRQSAEEALRRLPDLIRQLNPLKGSGETK